MAHCRNYQVAKCSVSLMTASYRLVGWHYRIRLGRMTPGEMPPTKLILSGTLGGSPLIHIYTRNTINKLQPMIPKTLSNHYTLYQKFRESVSEPKKYPCLYSGAPTTVFLVSDNTQPAMMDDRIPKEVPTGITHLRPSYQ